MTASDACGARIKCGAVPGRFVRGMAYLVLANLAAQFAGRSHRLRWSDQLS